MMETVITFDVHADRVEMLRPGNKLENFAIL